MNLSFLAGAANKRWRSPEAKCLPSDGASERMMYNPGQTTSPLCPSLLTYKMGIIMIHAS